MKTDNLSSQFVISKREFKNLSLWKQLCFVTAHFKSRVLLIKQKVDWVLNVGGGGSVTGMF